MSWKLHVCIKAFFCIYAIIELFPTNALVVIGQSWPIANHSTIIAHTSFTNGVLKLATALLQSFHSLCCVHVPSDKYRQGHRF